MMRLKDTILEMIHNRKCPRGFWFPENINEQKCYILELVKTELNIRTPAAYLCLFHINDLIRLNSTIVTKFGMANVYRLLEDEFGIPRYLLATNKNIPRDKRIEYNDFIRRIMILSESPYAFRLLPEKDILKSDMICTNKTDYKWYNIFDKKSAELITKMYKNPNPYKSFIDTIFYN